MNVKVEDIIIGKKFNSYDDFEKFFSLETENPTFSEKLNKFISKISNFSKISGNKSFFKRINLINNSSQKEVLPFFYNMFWFYRWILTYGFRYLEQENAFKKVRRFLFEIERNFEVVKNISDKIPWAKIFLCTIEFNGDLNKGKNCMDSWTDIHIKIKKQIIGSFIERNKLTGIKGISYIVNAWLVLHVLVSESKFEKIGDFEEEILLNYISLIDLYPELEHLFGFCIERDLEKVFIKLRS